VTPLFVPLEKFGVHPTFVITSVADPDAPKNRAIFPKLESVRNGPLPYTVPNDDDVTVRGDAPS
jgi:hypothetical protein